MTNLFWALLVGNLFLNSYWAFKSRLKKDECWLLALVRPVLETANSHLTALVEAVLFVGFCKMVIHRSLFLLSEGVGCCPKVFLYRYLCEDKAWNRAVLEEHLTVDSSC